MTILGYTWVNTYTISIDFNFSLGKQKIKIKENFLLVIRMCLVVIFENIFKFFNT